jgi:acyl transferase domain-containing protein
MKRTATELPIHSIAIVGMAGRFPGARSLEDFWRNIRDGVESLESFSDADLEAAGVDAAVSTSAGYVRQGTVLADADMFDAGFFGISPREAQILDPQQRIFLECAWEALENAGYAADASQRATAVYAGSGMNTYLLTQILRDPALIAAAGGYQLMLASDKDFLCTRVSYKLDLRGPSISLQTACSTSLVAVISACRALVRNECDLALAGGVSIPFPQRAGYLFEPGMILSPDGRCRPFDALAAGTRPGAGCGIVVLKRLADAIADRDTIHAVIRGSAINNDGAGKAGYTAPSVDGQVEVIATAQALAGVEPRDVGYVEAHGTATPLGDPIEIAALTQVFRASTAERGFCRLGSLKANLGHLDAAAGVASLIKTVLVLKHREIPPLVNFTTPNPQLELESGPFVASASRTDWSSEGPRRAAVSSFGIGGTNAHAVLEEAPSAAERAAVRGPHLLLFSAKTPAALDHLTADLSRWLEAQPDVRMDDVEWTLQAGRRAFAHRRALVVDNRTQAIELLARPQPPVLTGSHEGGVRPVAFLFSGQGSQYPGMGATLYVGERVFRDAIDRCAALLEPHLGLDLRTVMFADSSSRLIHETRLAQPALFVTEYALAALWASWGIKPTAMLGHSIGEYTAAHLSGVISLEDASGVVAMRGKLMQQMPPGAMAAVFMSAARLQEHLNNGVEIAAANAPELCTVAGPVEAVSDLLGRLLKLGVEARALHTSHAFHSVMMQPVLAPFTEYMRGIELNPPTIPYLSNLTGTWITASQATSPEYYAQHLRCAVKFEAGVRVLGADPANCLLEVGPGNALTTLARLTLGQQDQARAVHSMARPGEGREDAAVVREAAGRLWLAGAELDFAGMHADARPYRIPLPTYPFERQRHWVNTNAAPVALVPQARAERGFEDWSYAPMWTRDDSGVSNTERLTGNWLVLGDDDSLTQEVLAALRKAGAAAILVQRGKAFKRLDEARYTTLHNSPDEMALLGKATSAVGVIHLWGIGRDPLPARGVYDTLIALGVGLASDMNGEPLRIIHASTRLSSILDESGQQPRDALALGPTLVLPAEYPGLHLRSVDLEVSDARKAAFALLREAAVRNRGARAAWRGGRRWVLRYQRVVLPAFQAAGSPFKHNGIYLITGGLGGIGLTLAKWLAREFKARLLLTARSAMPPRAQWDSRLASRAASDRVADAILAIRDMEADGGEVIVAAADAADEHAMAAAIATARQQWGALNGVIHAAGISGPGTIAAMDRPDDTNAVLNPKVSGLEVLVRLLGEQPLDLVALMSSINAVVGAPGTCAYSAANAVLDAFAEGASHPSAWQHVVSINWGAWRDVGMAAHLEVPAARKAEWQKFVAAGIPPEMGVEAFTRAVSSRRRRVIVEAHDWLTALDEFEAQDLTAARAPLPPSPASARDVPARPALSSTFAEPQSDVEQRLSRIWSQVLGVERIGRHDDFFELGGHSLLGTRVLAYVREAFGTRLELREIFDSPTLEKMARRIGAEGATSEADNDREEIEF